jgi:hypothetical protein
METDKSLREHLVNLLSAADAFTPWDAAIVDWPVPLRGVRPPGLPYSAWQLLEHLRLAQWDILEFSRDAGHVSPDFPAGYWPSSEAPPSEAAWDDSMAQFRRDLEKMIALVKDPSVDLFAPIPHGDGQTVLREAMLVAKHNAYHLGQLVTVRRLLGAWEDR